MYKAGLTSEPYGMGMGGGAITVDGGGDLAVTGAGGVLAAGGGALTVQAGGTLDDANTGRVGFLIVGGTLHDAGTLSTPAALLVNTAASVTVAAGGVLTAPLLGCRGRHLGERRRLADGGRRADRQRCVDRRGDRAGDGAVRRHVGGRRRPVGGGHHAGRRRAAGAEHRTTGFTSILTSPITLAGGDAVIDFSELPFQVSDSLVAVGGTLDLVSAGVTLAALDLVNNSGFALVAPVGDGETGTDHRRRVLLPGHPDRDAGG